MLHIRNGLANIEQHLKLFSGVGLDDRHAQGGVG